MNEHTFNPILTWGEGVILNQQKYYQDNEKSRSLKLRFPTWRTTWPRGEHMFTARLSRFPYLSLLMTRRLHIFYQNRLAVIIYLLIGFWNHLFVVITRPQDYLSVSELFLTNSKNTWTVTTIPHYLEVQGRCSNLTQLNCWVELDFPNLFYTVHSRFNKLGYNKISL